VSTTSRRASEPVPSSQGRLPTRVVNGHITLALGEHKVLWTVNDSYHTAMSQQAVTVAKKADCGP